VKWADTVAAAASAVSRAVVVNISCESAFVGYEVKQLTCDKNPVNGNRLDDIYKSRASIPTYIWRFRLKGKSYLGVIRRRRRCDTFFHLGRPPPVAFQPMADKARDRYARFLQLAVRVSGPIW
jgi:hypothetical protein